MFVLLLIPQYHWSLLHFPFLKLGKSVSQVSLAPLSKVQLIATKTKLEGLQGRPLMVDTGDLDLDHQLAGTKKVVTGYRDFVLYPVGLAN